MSANPSIAVVIPCYNESLTIENVVRDYRKELPEAAIYVFDNNSSDGTGDIAAKAGAVVIKELRQGKGYVNQAFMEKVDADIYVTIDGDGTYPAAEVHKLLQPILDGKAHMVVGSRLTVSADGAFRPMHIFGNVVLTNLINRLFHTKFTDILSGYRVFTREFAEHVPLVTGGFQTETELTIQAIEKDMTVIEIPIHYGSRPDGSNSKLNTFRDGWLILITIAMYLRDHNPLRFFIWLAMIWILTGELLFGVSSLVDLGPAERVLVHGIIIIGAMTMVMGGMIMSAVNTRFREMDVTIRKVMRKCK